MPMESWRTAGVTALDLTGGVQPISVTETYLQQVLKVQQPKVVMLDLYMVGQTAEFQTVDAHNSLDHMPPGLPRLAAVSRSIEATQWFEMLWPLQVYHSRWVQVGRQDFAPDKYSGVAFARGAAYIPESAPISLERKFTDISEAAYQRDLAYIRSMAQRCERSGAQLLLFTAPTPWQARVGEDLLLARLERDLAADNPSVRYLDLGAGQEFGLDASKDFKDELHVSFSGAVKTTESLTKYLVKTYGLQDHRPDEIAGAWDTSLAQYDEVFKRQ